MLKHQSNKLTQQLAPWIGVVLFILTSEFQLVPTAHAQIEPENWSDPINISNNTRTPSMPLITADGIGNVHVVWAEDLDSEIDAIPDTIFYSTLADDYWSPPVDILAVPFGERSDPHAMEIDPAGRLVILWSTNSQIYISSVELSNAQLPQSWTTNVVDTGKSFPSAGMHIDSEGVYHITYLVDDTEIVYTSSDDGGVTWAPLSQVTRIEEENFALLNVTMIVDQTQNIHVSWTMTAESNNWGPVGVLYARSIDGGASWQAPIEMAFGAGHGASDLLVDSLQQVHIAWNGTGGIGGRYHRRSVDGGASWSETTTVVDRTVTGMPGPPTLLEDRAGMLHMVFPGLGNEQESIWYTSSDNENWQLISKISGMLPHSEGSAATVSLGNQIHVAWVEYASGDIWYAVATTGAPGVEPGFVSSVDDAQMLQENDLEDRGISQDTSEEVEQIDALQFDLSGQREPSSPDNTRALLYGLAAAVAIISVVLLVQLGRRSYRSS